MANEFDSFFEAYAKQADSDSKSYAGRSSSYQKDFENIYWTGLVQGVPSVLRVVGAPPDTITNTEVDSYSAKTVNIAWIVDDNGKKFKLVYTDDPSYIINRIIARVKETRWVKGADGVSVKTYPVKEQFPEIYNIIDKNGIDPSDKRTMYERGWNGQKVIMMNVIDRAKMDIHKEIKHTMMLAKEVKSNPNGGEFVTEGVSAFALTDKIKQMFKYYGSWEKYDLAITKTGDMSNAYIIDNATKTPERVEGKAANYISFEDHLTDEEKSWGKYDLSKLYRTTSSTRIFNRLKHTIKRIDAALKTTFYEELEANVEKEKELFAELYGNEEEETVQPTVEVVEEKPAVIEAPVTRTRVTVDKKPGSDLPYYNSLSDTLKAKIVSAVKLSDNKWDIEWDMESKDLAQCPDCGAISPLDATKCPCCGIDF